MVNRLFLTYGLIIALGLSTALARGWTFGSSDHSGSSGARGTTGFWGWGGGK